MKQFFIEIVTYLSLNSPDDLEKTTSIINVNFISSIEASKNDYGKNVTSVIIMNNGSSYLVTESRSEIYALIPE